MYLIPNILKLKAEAFHFLTNKLRLWRTSETQNSRNESSRAFGFRDMVHREMSRLLTAHEAIVIFPRRRPLQNGSTALCLCR